MTFYPFLTKILDYGSGAEIFIVFFCGETKPHFLGLHTADAEKKGIFNKDGGQLRSL